MAFRTIGKNFILFVSTEAITLSINVTSKEKNQQVLYTNIDQTCMNS